MVLTEEVIVEQSSDVCILAPHGGAVEPHTASQARQVVEDVSCSGWMCEAHNGSESAFDKYHVPSTRIGAWQFPRLRELPAPFSLVVSLHGHTGDKLLLGGIADSFYSSALASYLQDGLDCAVRRVQSGPKSGTSPYNIANRLCEPNGQSFQLEQPLSLREDQGEAVADIVSDFISYAERQRSSPEFCEEVGRIA